MIRTKNKCVSDNLNLDLTKINTEIVRDRIISRDFTCNIVLNGYSTMVGHDRLPFSKTM